MTEHDAIGKAIAAVYWTPTGTYGYARFFIRLVSGKEYEATVAGLRDAKIEVTANNYSHEFRDVLDRGKIAEIRTDDETVLAIRVDTGHVLVLCGTFDGEHTGNNFYVDNPLAAEEWAAEFQRMRQIM